MIEELLAMHEMQEEILQFTLSPMRCLGAGKTHRFRDPAPEASGGCYDTLNKGYNRFPVMRQMDQYQNENWMQRKFNTVRTLETSTLHAAMLLKKSEQTLATGSWMKKNMQLQAGGFPIRIEEVGVIGAVIVSGLPHFADHDLIVKCISRYLHVDEVPRIRGSVNI